MGLNICSNNKLVRNSASVDFEWIPYKGVYSDEKTRLTAAAFCTNQGTRIILHISQFEKSYPNPERQLILAIIRYLDKFDLTFGWYTTGVAKYDENTGDYLDGRDSDFLILDKRCEFHNIPSPITYSKSGSSTFLYDRCRKHIDLCKVYGKEIIQKGVFNDKYRTLQLDEVSGALLDVGKFKDSEGDEVSGEAAHLLQVGEQINYVKRDAEITMMLACYNNCMVLRIMEFIAFYSEMDYIITCHTGITKWYANIYNKMIERDECTLQSSEHKIPKQEIGGGNSIEPKRGFYKSEPIDELDVKGMYPTIAIEHNISFETVNCRCCQDNPNVRIPAEVMNEINQRLQKKGLPNRIEPYWICQQRNGAFPTKLKKLIRERERYQQLVNQELAKPKEQQQHEMISYYEARQLALKLLANAGYGAFARKEFAYSDYRVSEIITGYGRLIHKQMEKMGFEWYGFQTVFGFTDSIFIRHAAAGNTITTDSSKEHIAQFLEDCQNQLNVKIEHKNRFLFTIIFDKKNRYIAWIGNSADRPILKNLDGMSRKYPTWIKQQIEKIATHLITNSNDDVIPVIKQAFEDLDYGRFEAKDMQFTEQLDKSPNQYPNDKDIRVKVLGLELCATKGELIYWYESLSNKRGYSTKIKDLSIKKYKQILWDKMEDMLEIAEYNVAKIKQDLLYESESGMIITSNSRK
ncbi:MAG TPA: DNA polymerase domain-containing protein [Nitrososphaeraceae archaeon]|nr:DNA polymerase domain-containing protein [Nitrososphaeraceae archaeon]